MLHLVRIALTRPYTFVVLALLILIVGPLAALRTPVDIFPEIRIPVIAVVWQYTGLPPDQMGELIAQMGKQLLTAGAMDKTPLFEKAPAFVKTSGKTGLHVLLPIRVHIRPHAAGSLHEQAAGSPALRYIRACAATSRCRDRPSWLSPCPPQSRRTDTIG